ncbi:MAG: phosphate/phosphite/phosphonate ABC transporter substrate-binding protein [Candidatus Omnitrophota bacterium]|nr:phosphate/phosphite/phosphonate ABC transporter substrate-binding protein [Candidatus Omnitrophota bacterium]
MIKDKLSAAFFILLAGFLFAGCEGREDIKKVDLDKIEKKEDVSKEPLKIKIGLIPEQDIRKMAARYEPLAEYLSKKLNMKVVLVYLDNYGEVCDKFIYNQLDAAFFGSFSYALTHVKAGIEPIARPDYQGVSTYRGLIVVREDSNIKNVSDMKGKRLALVHQATYAGYLYPLYYFKERGINNLEAYFSKIEFAGSHDESIFAVLRGEADIATPKDLVYQRVIKENPDLEKKLAVLSASEPVPSNALCVSKKLDPILKNKLKDALLNLNNDPEAKPVLESLGGAIRFVETRDEDYRHLYDIINALEIDLNAYPYYERPDMGFDRIEDAKEPK